MTERQHLAVLDNPRGPQTAWGSDHGYLNKSASTLTGLTQLGARAYDPILGKFLSVDPVLDPGNPQQNNGYGYAHNNPITTSDPTGLIPYEGGLPSSVLSVPVQKATAQNLEAAWAQAASGDGLTVYGTRYQPDSATRKWAASYSGPRASAVKDSYAAFWSARFEVLKSLLSEAQSAKMALAASGIAADMTPNEAEAFGNAADGLDYLDENVFDPLTVSPLPPLTAAGGFGKIGSKAAGRGLKILLSTAARTNGGTPFLTRGMQRSIAKEFSWKAVRGSSHGQPIFQVGKNYVSWDTRGTCRRDLENGRENQGSRCQSHAHRDIQSDADKTIRRLRK